MRRVHCGQAGQVLVFFALVLPILLLPAAAYAVDAAVTAEGFARLQEVAARAAEEAAQQVDAAQLRSGGGLALDVAAARLAAQEVVSVAEPSASLVGVTVIGTEVRVVTTEVLVLPLNFLGTPATTLRAIATARLASGYDSPSSLLPLPVSTF
jgi:hypothetical protein